MAAQIQKGHTYNPGDVVDAADLNAHVDAAIARVTGGLISEQTAVTAVPTDYILIGDTSDSNKLKKALVSTLPAGVTSVGLTAAPASVFSVSGSPVTAAGTLALSMDAQAPKTFLAGPLTTPNAFPAFRPIAITDITSARTIDGTFNIDLTLGNVFFKQLGDNGSHHFTFVADSGTPGQVFKVWVRRDTTGGGTGIITWQAAGTPGDIRWPGGVQPVMTTGNSVTDIFEFVCMAANSFYGIRWGANFAI